MARKRKLQSRVRVIGAQVEESIRQDGENARFESAPSDELFQIDTKGGTISKKQKLEQKPSYIKSNKFVAEKANKYEVEAVKKLQRAKELSSTTVAKRSSKHSSADSNGPLWGATGVVPVPNAIASLNEYIAPALVKKVAKVKRVASTRHKVKKVNVPAPGQSYNPDFDSHQDVLAEAVASELEREEQKAELAEPLAKGLSDETLQFINDKDSDDDEESDGNVNEDESFNKKKKPTERKTTAQRNKQARHHQMELDHKSTRGKKNIIKQINASQHILNSIIKDEKDAVQKATLKKVLLEQKLEEEPLARVAGKKVKLDRPTPVLLSDELTGSLRTLRPRGDPLLDRFDSMLKRNLIEVNHARSKQKGKYKIIEAKK